MLRLIRALIVIVPAGFLFTFLYLGSTRNLTARSAIAATLGQCSIDQIRSGRQISERFPDTRATVTARSQKAGEDGEFQLWNTPQGQFWYHGAPSALDFFVLAEEEFDIYQTARIKPGAVVIDCGANYGTFTRRALTRGASKVIAIEINPEIQEALRRTFAAEIKDGRVVVYGKGVWDKETELNLRGDSVVLDRNAAPKLVSVTTIDKIVSELGVPTVDFIKMDIEGAEKNALRGARATLAKFSPDLAISAEHLPDDVDRIPPLVKELAGDRYRRDNSYCDFNSLFSATPNVLTFSR